MFHVKGEIPVGLIEGNVFQTNRKEEPTDIASVILATAEKTKICRVLKKTSFSGLREGIKRIGIV